MHEWSWEIASEAERVGLRVIGRAVRRARLAAGLSQQQLSWRAGVSQSTISRVENARLGALRIRTLARLIGVLGMGPDFIFPGEPDPPNRRLPGAPPVARPGAPPLAPPVTPLGAQRVPGFGTQPVT